MNLRSVRAFSLLLSLAFIGLIGCGERSDNGASSTITVYSPHGKLKPEVKARFEKKYPQYTVQFLDLGGGEILPRVQAEKERPGADVWWGGAPGDFNRAEELGLLEPYAPEWTKKLPDDAKSRTDGWVATYRTPEVIMYNPQKVKPEDAPKQWDDLLDPKWKGKIAIRDVRPSATMKTIFGALILRESKRAGSVDAGFEFLKKLDANTGTYAANPNILNEMLINPGPYAITVWNLPDAQQLVAEGKPIAYTIPDDTPVPVEPVAIIKGAKNPAGAKAFHDFVNTPEELVTLAKERYRIPARTDLPQDQLPDWMQKLQLKKMEIDWKDLDQHTEEWMARWDSEIKGKNK